MFVADMARIEIHAADHCVQKCQYCSHAADLATPRLYSPDDYIPIFESLANQGIHWRQVDILGGEPFLNPQLEEIVSGIRPFTTVIGIMTNGFWLQTEKDIQKYDSLLRKCDYVFITLYEPIVQKMGGFEEFQRLLGILRSTYINVKMWYFALRITSVFAKIEFYDDPRPIVNTSCNFRFCIQLLPEWRLLQCCAARRVPGHRALDLTYDISGEVDEKDLLAWLGRPTLDLCRYCSIATEGIVIEPWVNLH